MNDKQKAAMKEYSEAYGKYIAKELTHEEMDAAYNKVCAEFDGRWPFARMEE